MAREPANYVGAIYGSLLAASVVVAAGDYALSPRRLALTLAATGLVFWLAHAYARLVGDRLRHAAFSWAEVRGVARHEWPLFKAVLPPAAAALIVGLIGESDLVAAWAALITAVVQQVAWATFAAARAGASRRLVAASAAGNLVLGLLIVALKAVVH
jgi:hypothetical protein